MKLLQKVRDDDRISSSLYFKMGFADFDEQAVEELIQSLQEAGEKERNRLTGLFDQIAPELLIKYEEEELKRYFPKADWEFNHFLLDCESEEKAYFTFHDIVKRIESSERMDYPLYKRGKKMIELLIDKDWMNDWEIEHVIKEKLQQPFFDVEGLLHVYAMGMLRKERWIPTLVQMLERTDEDFLLEEASWALNLYQSNKAVDAVYPFCKSDDFIFPIGVLRDTKSDAAVHALKSLYHEVDNDDAKEYIAESLCYQFSREGMPEISDYANERGLMTVDFEEAAYGFYRVMGEHHPMLEQWRIEAEERERRFQKVMGAPVKKEKKVGRNDPCPCDSGKKYKKCCGK